MVIKLDPVLDNRVAARNHDGDYLYSGLQVRRLKVQEEKRLAYKWDERIHPSSLCFDDCPEKYFEDIKKRSNSSSDGLHRMALGIALHELFLKEIGKHPDMVYPIAGIPQVMLDSKRKDWEAEFKKVHPSIPFDDPETGFSGEADAVINIKDKPVLVDLKFPQSDDQRWGEICKKLNKEEDDRELGQYICQISIYSYFMNKLKMYDKPIEMAGICYMNPKVDDKTGISTFEDYRSLEPLWEKTELLVQHWSAARLLAIAGQPIVCEYPLCKVHHAIKPRGRRKKKA